MKPRIDLRRDIQNIFRQQESGPDHGPYRRTSQDIWPDLAQHPRLVLGIRITIFENIYLSRTSGQPKPGRVWMYLIHHAGGKEQQTHMFFVTELHPQAQVEAKLKALAEHLMTHPLGGGPMGLDQLVEYQTRLREYLGVDCQHSYADLLEGIYPIDPTPAHLARLVEDELPAELDALVEGEGTRKSSPLGSWGLWMLSANG